MNKLILLLMFITIGGCCNTQNIVDNTFTNEEKLYIPYDENEIIKWNNNSGDIISGSVINYNSKIDRYSDEYCSTYVTEEIEVNLSIQNEFYSILFEKRGQTYINLTIYQSVNEIPKRVFRTFVSDFGFSTIEFNNETYNDSIKIDAYSEENVYLGTLIYSKTHGIEFILFEDGTWYKRAE